MKVLAIVLFCAIAAAQSRSAVKVVDVSCAMIMAHETVPKYWKAQPNSNHDRSSEAVQEIKPWLVHLRYAIRTSGYLQTAVGSLISPTWVLTASNVDAASFIWMRYGVVNVINPALVTETSIAVQSYGNFALININRDVTSLSGLLAPIGLALQSGATRGESCGFSVNLIGGPGEQLQCTNIHLEEKDDKLIGQSNLLSEFDLGAALVSDGQQIAVLVSVDGENAEYAPLGPDELEWISEVAGVPAPAPPPQPESSESEESEESEERSRVNFVGL